MIQLYQIILFIFRKHFMYHIANDKRAIHSAQKVCESFNKIIQTKPLEEISVSELQRDSKVSRATIYRLFDTPVDILLYQMNQIFEETSRTIFEHKVSNMDELFITLLNIWVGYKPIWQAAFDNRRSDLIFAAHSQFLSQKKEVVQQVLGIDDNQSVYLTTFISAAFTALLLSWLKTGGTEGPEKIRERMKENLRCFGTLQKMQFMNLEELELPEKPF